MADMTVSVPEISCGHCKETLETALLAEPGVRTAVVDIDRRRVAVSSAGLAPEVIVGVIEDAGYAVGAVAVR